MKSATSNGTQRHAYSNYYEKVVENPTVKTVLAIHFGLFLEDVGFPYPPSVPSNTEKVDYGELLKFLGEVESWTFAPSEHKNRTLTSLFQYMLRWSQITENIVHGGYSDFIDDVDTQFLETAELVLSGKYESYDFSKLGHSVRILLPYFVREYMETKK